MRRWCDEGRLVTTRSAGGHRRSTAPPLAAYLRQAEQAYQPDGGVGRSARNRFTGIVTKVERDKLTAVVELRSGSHRLVSLMTREAADELELEPGDLAVAVVKATTVIVEVPDPDSRGATRTGSDRDVPGHLKQNQFGGGRARRRAGPLELVLIAMSRGI